MRRAIVFASVLACAAAFGAVTGEWRVNLLRSSTTIDTPTGATEAEAWAKCQALIPKSATTSTTYRCQTPVFTAVVTPDPVTCPPAPASTTRAQQCPAGTTGSWPQTSTSTVGPAPACTVTTTWAPSSPPAGACVTPPPPPPPPPPPTPTVALMYSATAGGTYAALDGATVAAGINVRLDGTCPNPAGPWAFYLDAATLPVNIENLCPYELLGDNAIFDTKALNNGPHTIRAVGSPPIAATFTVNNVTPPSPTGTAALKWTPPTQNTNGSTIDDLAGYRVLYGQSLLALTQMIDVNNPGLSTYIVDKLASGPWFFAVRAYNTGGAESVNSGVATKIVP